MSEPRIRKELLRIQDDPLKKISAVPINGELKNL